MRVTRTAQWCFIYIGQFLKNQGKSFQGVVLIVFTRISSLIKKKNASTMRISVIYEWWGIILVNKLCLWKERITLCLRDHYNVFY